MLINLKNPILKQANQGIDGSLYFDTRVTAHHACFDRGCQAVSLLVSDTSPASVSGQLGDWGIKYMAPRSSGFNHVWRQSAKDNKLNVAGVTLKKYIPKKKSLHLNSNSW